MARKSTTIVPRVQPKKTKQDPGAVGIGKRTPVLLKPGVVNIWDLLRAEIEPLSADRPENSVTAEEFAKSHGFSDSHSRKLLMNLAKAGKLKAIPFRSNGTRATCYIPAE